MSAKPWAWEKKAKSRKSTLAGRFPVAAHATARFAEIAGTAMSAALASIASESRKLLWE